MTKNYKTAAIVIQSEHFEWLKKHPSYFVNNIISRIEMDETDKYPGYSRWDGDGVPGTQVVWIGNPEDKNKTCLISVGNGFGVKILSTVLKNNSNKETKIELLKLLAEKLGYRLVKK